MNFSFQPERVETIKKRLAFNSSLQQTLFLHDEHFSAEQRRFQQDFHVWYLFHASWKELGSALFALKTEQNKVKSNVGQSQIRVVPLCIKLGISVTHCRCLNDGQREFSQRMILNCDEIILRECWVMSFHLAVMSFRLLSAIWKILLEWETKSRWNINSYLGETSFRQDWKVNLPKEKFKTVAYRKETTRILSRMNFQGLTEMSILEQRSFLFSWEKYLKVTVWKFVR